MTKFQGLYINMDRAADRRACVEAMLAGIGLSDHYRRLPAVDGSTLDTTWSQTKAGAKGCFMSHVNALAEAAKFDGVTHVIEDDVILSREVEPFIQSPQASAALERFDLVFLSLWVDYPILPSLVTKRRAARGRIDIFDVREARISSTDSYIVNGKTAAKLLALLNLVGPTKPVDNMLQYMVRLGEVKAAFVLPFLSCIDLATGAGSSIVNIPFDEFGLLTLARRLLYVDDHVSWPARTDVNERLLLTLDYLQSIAQSGG